jgi:undecaprenyl-diphosphatase
MNLPHLYWLLGACLLLFILERFGLPTTLQLNFKGDVKRETRWLAQYGQAISALVAAAIVWQLEPDLSLRRRIVIDVMVASLGAAIVGMLIKRLLGRVRPGREHAGRFLGPTWRHANSRESFPSNHTASAVAMSAVLAHFYPGASATFWALAIACALLRYVLDAHWPSDVVGGAALGYAAAMLAVQWSAAL